MKIIPVLKSLDELADQFLDIQADHLDAKYKYTNHTIMNALIVFNAVVGNVAIQRMREVNTTNEAGESCAEMMGSELREFIKKWTGFDPHKYY